MDALRQRVVDEFGDYRINRRNLFRARLNFNDFGGEGQCHIEFFKSRALYISRSMETGACGVLVRGLCLDRGEFNFFGF